MIKHYVSEAETNWTPKTKAEVVDDTFFLLLSVVGDVPIQTVDRKRMNEFKQVLRKLPPNRNKLKKYRDKTIDQLIRMKLDKTLSERTINKHLTRIGTRAEFLSHLDVGELKQRETDMYGKDKGDPGVPIKLGRSCFTCQFRHGNVLKGYLTCSMHNKQVWEYAYCPWHKNLDDYNTIIQFKKYIDKGSGLDFMKTVGWDK